MDEFDSPFKALSLELGAPLWTGDKKLTIGLQNKGATWLLSTEKIKSLRDRE